MRQDAGFALSASKSKSEAIGHSAIASQKNGRGGTRPSSKNPQMRRMQVEWGVPQAHLISSLDELGNGFY